MFKRATILPIFFLLLVNLWGCSPRVEGDVKQVCFDKKCIKAELAETPVERGKGLQFRKSMGRDEGMLFIFPSSNRHTFWMKDTFISLDIIWMDSKKRIVFVIPNILPCETEQCPVYTPGSGAKYVLEVNAGVTTELGLSVGDRAVF